MTCNEFSALVPSYLKGELSGARLEAFEEHYFRCDKCFLELQIEEKLTNKDFTLKLKGEEKAFPRSWVQPLAVAASLVMVAVLSVFLVTSANLKKKLYSVSQFSPPSYITSESRHAGQVGQFEAAMELYNQEAYGKALSVLKKIPPDTRDMRAVFFKGVCHLLEENNQEAIREFDLIINEMNPSYFDEAIFYKAIALLRQNNVAGSKELLYNLSDMFSPYAPKARAILDKLGHL